MKISILTLYVFIGFIILNGFQIRDFIYNNIGNKFFYEGNYDESINYYNKLANNISKYNTLNLDYKQSKYKDLIEKYTQLLDCKEDNSLCFNSTYNLANTYYRLGESETDLEKRLELWNSSIDLYTDVINIKYDKEAEKNLYFVTNKIKKLKEEIEERNKKKDNKKEDKEENKNTGKDSEKNNNKKSEQDGEKQKNGEKNQDNNDKTDKNGENKDDGNNKEGENSEINKNKQELEKSGKKNSGEKGIGKQEENKKLSDYEKAYLEKRQEALKKAQKELGSEYNKKYNNKKFDSLEDFLFNEPFFDNGLINNNDQKDW